MIIYVNVEQWTLDTHWQNIEKKVKKFTHLFFTTSSDQCPQTPESWEVESITIMPSRPLPPPPISSFLTKTRVMFLALTISVSVVILCSVLYFLYHLWLSLVQRAKSKSVKLKPSPLKQVLPWSSKGSHTRS